MWHRRTDIQLHVRTQDRCLQFAEEIGRQLPEWPAHTRYISPVALQVALRGDAAAGPLPANWKQGHKLRNVCPWLFHLCLDSESPGHGRQWGGDLLPKEVRPVQSSLAAANSGSHSTRLLGPIFLSPFSFPCIYLSVCTLLGSDNVLVTYMPQKCT